MSNYPIESGEPKRIEVVRDEDKLTVVGLGADAQVRQSAVAGGRALRFQGTDRSAATRETPLTPLVTPAWLNKWLVRAWTPHPERGSNA